MLSYAVVLWWQTCCWNFVADVNSSRWRPGELPCSRVWPPWRDQGRFWPWERHETSEWRCRSQLLSCTIHQSQTFMPAPYKLFPTIVHLIYYHSRKLRLSAVLVVRDFHVFSSYKYICSVCVQMLEIIQSSNNDWQTVEAAMFVMTSVARHVDVYVDCCSVASHNLTLCYVCLSVCLSVAVHVMTWYGASKKTFIVSALKTYTLCYYRNLRSFLLSANKRDRTKTSIQWTEWSQFAVDYIFAVIWGKVTELGNSKRNYAK